MANKKLGNARMVKNDEFYTQYNDIHQEMNAYMEFNPDVFRDKTILLPCDDPEWSNFTKFFAANFERFGIRKLISTSYAAESKKIKEWTPTLFEMKSPFFDADKSRTNGKIFVLERDAKGNRKIDVEDLEWHYMEGDGDFRSEEVKLLRDQSDIIITNPPFSMFRDFMSWIVESGKQFIVIGNLNAVSYKEIFPYIRDNKMWFGSSYFHGGAAYFIADSSTFDPEKMSNEKNAFFNEYGQFLWRVNGVRWYTNIDHGKRHDPIPLMSMEENIMYSRHKEIKGKQYIKYENYDAIEVPFYDAIPKDYDGVMGVPKSFLDKYCPEQFDIVGIAEGDSGKELGLAPYPRELKKLNNSLRDGQLYYIDEEGMPQKPFARILIRKKH